MSFSLARRTVVSQAFCESIPKRLEAALHLRLAPENRTVLSGLNIIAAVS